MQVLSSSCKSCHLACIFVEVVMITDGMTSLADGLPVLHKACWHNHVAAKGKLSRCHLMGLLGGCCRIIHGPIKSTWTSFHGSISCWILVDKCPQIHSHGIWCNVGKRISNETTIYRRGKWMPAFLLKRIRKPRLETTNRVSTLHFTGDLCEIVWTFL
jgi:hypothetical protein